MLLISRTDSGAGIVYSARLRYRRDMLEERRKRLRFRAWRRGFREIDLILGGFVDAHGDELDAAGVDAFERLLEQRDLDVYDWIVGRSPAPAEFDTPLLARLQRHRLDRTTESSQA
ncbi:MAG: succinate dehydrogenase assembly factor 2 [Hyphomonadaceae bacterium]|nr:succinate dehydrogenase assembly factor 2 [Hyphomonadaceae bacterium]